MYTSVAVMTLSGFLAAAPAASSPSWLEDYDAALVQGKREGKPLAVFIGKGPKGYANVCRLRVLTRDVKQVLAKKYVCVYVDTQNKAGQKWARAFGLDRGLVISDRSRRLQAFRHEGSLAPKDLRRYLSRFSNPDLVVRSTATHVSNSDSEQVRYGAISPPVTPVAPPPVPAMGMGMGMGRGGC
jgi:hypothetical protein